MLRVAMEIWPQGQRELRENLGTLTIINEGTGSHEVGNYCFVLDRPKRRARRATLTGWPRSRSCWELLAVALDALKIEGVPKKTG